MKIKICKGSKFKNQAFSIGVTNPDWAINEGKYIVSFGHKADFIKTIEDGMFRYKDGKPVLALDIATEILKQNRFNDSSYGAEGRVYKDYYGSHFSFDYTPELHKFFENNRLPIPADGLALADRAINTAFAELKIKGICDEVPTSEELSAFLAMKRAKTQAPTQNTQIGIGMGEAPVVAPAPVVFEAPVVEEAPVLEAPIVEETPAPAPASGKGNKNK
jgi:hypothetical protein